MNELTVWREYKGDVEQVGSLAATPEGVQFSYADAYAGQPISASLPVQPEPFSEQRTASFFKALIPEGTARAEFARMFHASKEEFTPFLEQLRDESIGALLFSGNGEAPCSSPSYRDVEQSFFEELASRPLETAVATMGKTRLSLSGAMAKVGLYRNHRTGSWHYPLGGAPSTHIIKAADGKRFPFETVNEALCLGAARRCDFPTAACELLDVGANEPLLVVERFDRTVEDDAPLIDGLPLPQRLHQEDFCQAQSLSLKYEPTDGRYLSLLARCAHEHCANAFGEKSLLMKYTFFHYLVGNCDNHLKNYALLYSPDWRTQEVAPLYDVVNTVLYPDIYLEMGVSFGGDRRIDHVTRQAIEDAVVRCGLPARLASGALEDLARQIEGALEEEADALARQGFPQAREVFDGIIGGVRERASICLS